MSKKEHIVLIPTTRCNVGCSHCMHDAKMNGIDTPLDFFIELIEKLETEGVDSSFELTGLGEPLLYPHLKEALDLLISQFGKYKIGLTSSGYTEVELDKKKVFLHLLSLEKSKQVALNVSYNLYADFEKRLPFLLKDIISSEHATELKIKTCVDENNALETVASLMNILIRTAKEAGLPESTIYSDLRYPDVPGYLKNHMIVMHAPQADIHIETVIGYTEKRGRATRIMKSNIAPPECLYFEKNKAPFIFYPDGYFYPCDKHVSNPKMRLGNIKKDSIRSVLAKRDRFEQSLRKYLTPIWKITGWLPCTLCKFLPK